MSSLKNSLFFDIWMLLFSELQEAVTTIEGLRYLYQSGSVTMIYTVIPLRSTLRPRIATTNSNVIWKMRVHKRELSHVLCWTRVLLFVGRRSNR
jgi:hypothetical protein